MSTEATRKFMERYFAAISNGPKSPQVVDQYVTDATLKEHIVAFEAGFPGYRLSVDDMVVEGDKVALRVTFSGVHQGLFQGVAPTGRGVSLPGMLFYRIESDKIAQFWMSADMSSLMQQLGAAPVPA